MISCGGSRENMEESITKNNFNKTKNKQVAATKTAIKNL